MNLVVERINEIDHLLAEAREIDGEERDRRAAVRAVEAQRKQMIKDLQEMIKSGQSSGDTALDIQILFADSTAKDGAYGPVSWLETAVKQHPAELFVVAGYSSLHVGLLPRSPSITWKFERGGRPDKFVGVAVEKMLYFGDAYRDLLPSRESEEPDLFSYYALDKGFRKGTEFQDEFYAKLDMFAEIVIGNSTVRRWMMTQRPCDALRAFIATKMLGKPIRPYAALDREIRDRRERFIPALIEAMDELERLEVHLAESQHSPAWGLEHSPVGTRGTIQKKIVKTENGVTIDFGFSHLIKNARQTLWAMVNNAALGCDMSDNPTWQKAAKMIAYTLPS